MADNDAKPMTGSDIETPPADTSFRPAEPLKNAGVEFSADTVGDATGTTGGTASAGTTLREGAGKLGSQATDRLRAYAADGQARAGDALGQIVQMLNDAAGQVDDKLGAQYGDYARQAAGTVNGFADTIRNKDVDELFNDVRTMISKSPAIAIGAAAALGFVVARIAQSGIEAERAPAGNNRA
ncbi:hypothetical protein SAMN05192583_2215 [Sphingomonas gellani]|uniref:Uncharacterized protein n=1 Tax=Sphingomonas gellani TaxID=1166340 RepID=A0A1H8ELE7_9SPHN|nr:hypothetical protein [Sphingomonas gellani]SEN19944.1 hypothetical protein SAMN05192583_2215 [Sphingomonas gellani]